MPTPDIDRDKSMYKSGQRRVVDYLIELKERQIENNLESGDINV